MLGPLAKSAGLLLETWKVRTWVSLGPALMLVAQFATVCGPASSRSVWSLPFEKLGASFTGVTVMVNVCGALVSTPPFAVPPLSFRVTRTVAVPEASLPVIESKLLEPVKLTWAGALEAAGKARALAIGPGLGRDAAAAALRDGLIASGDQRLVLDADALHELEPGDWGARAVLTPHAGELGRLLGESSDWVGAHRLEAAERCAELFGCVCLLKGADTIVAGAGDGTIIVLTDAPGLASAGTGDVLTGILAAFLAKGLEPRVAAAAAATAHGLAARSLPQRGLIASDVVSALPDVLG